MQGFRKAEWPRWRERIDEPRNAQLRNSSVSDSWRSRSAAGQENCRFTASGCRISSRSLGGSSDAYLAAPVTPIWRLQ